MPADTPDGIIGYTDESGNPFCAFIEIKTMTTPRAIHVARETSKKHGKLTNLRSIGRDHIVAQHFKSLVSTTAYRFQCIHHAATTRVNRVLFVVAKGSSCGVGEIIYAVLIDFSDRLINSYSYILDAIRTSAFRWVGDDATMIPENYNSLLEGTHASDMFSFASFYNLSMAYKKLVQKEGPMPPSGMIRPQVLVHWDNLKGGVDEFSRALTTLAYTNTSENPIVSTLGRLLSAQVSNAAVIHLFALAKSRNILPDSRHDSQHGLSYKKLRHRVSGRQSFASFARGLAKEYVLSLGKTSDKESPNLGVQRSISDDGSRRKDIGLQPFYHSTVVEKYNRPDDRARRLNSSLEHKRIALRSELSIAVYVRLHTV